ncbi:MAG: hypothetical protein ABIN67_14605 [Ferruginibacter sp.]
MKLILILLAVTGSFSLCLYNGKKNNSPVIAVENKSKSTLTEPVDFKTQLLPIFKSKCNPCHFPGGKMYGKMPFDSSQTIIDHGEGIIRRFKDEDQKALLRRYLDQNKSAVKFSTRQMFIRNVRTISLCSMLYTSMRVD